MNTRHRAGAIEVEQDDASSVVQSLRDDFLGLIAIFDRQLANGSGVSPAARSKIAEARAAAERGLRLSQNLVELLRSNP